MAQEIVQIQQMGDALRNTGYKNISSAVAEIVDNSVEAGEAKGFVDVFILLTEKVDSKTGRKSVKEIAIIDNGCGMDYEKLGSCLGIGFTTRADRKGMGRFGVGLPQASLHVCPRVSVYSWQEGYDNCKKVWLDIEKVKTGEQTSIEDPIEEKLDYKYEKFLKYNLDSKTFDFSKEGTLVLWQDCDRVSPKSTTFLMRDLEFVLGQKFRHLINNGRLNLYLINTENVDHYVKIFPNDPLMLMPNNLVLGDREKPGDCVLKNDNRDNAEPVFEPYATEDYPEGIILFPIQYYNKEGNVDTREVLISFSKVKKEFYTQEYIAKDPGSTEIGKHVKSLAGISIVRANREIDFGKFDFFDDVNEPEHRWWGCEIQFDPVLDEAFGVANNKQSVELKKLDLTDYMDEDVKPVWLQLYNVINKTISTMYKKNKEARQGSRSKVKSASASETIVNSVEENNTTESLSKRIKEATSEQELFEKGKAFIFDKDKDQTEEEVVEKTRQFLDNKVNFNYINWGKAGPFFDRSADYGNVTLTINIEHEFYKKFFEKVCSDPDAKTTFELFLASFAVAADELDVRQQDQNDNVIEEWNNKLRTYINKQLGKI